jgi:hypothetical protein
MAFICRIDPLPGILHVLAGEVRERARRGEMFHTLRDCGLLKWLRVAASDTLVRSAVIRSTGPDRC